MPETVPEPPRRLLPEWVRPPAILVLVGIGLKFSNPSHSALWHAGRVVQWLAVLTGCLLEVRRTMAAKAPIQRAVLWAVFLAVVVTIDLVWADPIGSAPR